MSAWRADAAPVAMRAAGLVGLVLPALLIVFFLSGISGLMYQVVWVRSLSLTFGVTSYAIATVLAGFMAGLGLGALIAGRFADRLRRPLLGYAIAEILIAVTGVLSPFLFAWVNLAYVAIVELIGLQSVVALTFIRFLLAFVVLLVPTTMMGATLPLIVRSSLLRMEGMSRNLSLLYGVNTLGAMIGVLTAGFYLIGRVGLQNTLVIAAALNLAAALIAVALDRARQVAPASDTMSNRAAASVERPYSLAAQRAVVIVFGISGALSFAYEVVWARVLSIFFDATTYGFTIMLAMVLLGIGAGSWAISPVISRRWNWLLIFAGLEAAVGLLGLLAIPLLANIVPITSAFGLYSDPGPLGQFSLRFMALVAALVVFPPMFLLGMTFPVAARIAGAGHADVGRRIGIVYAANVFGAIIGSVLGGFVLVPELGVARSLLLLGACSMGLAVALAWVAQVRPALWRPATLLAGVTAVILAVLLAPDLYGGIFRDRFRDQRVLFIDEGRENMATVAEYLDRPERALYLNGQPQASTLAFIAGFHQLIGHTGMLMRPDARRVLVIGFGGGATPGAVAQHAQADVEIVELSSAVIRAAPFFGEINRDVLHRPNVRLKVDDGRNHLLVTDTKYDVITADIIRPRHAGASNLYSLEYYRLAKDALADDGVMVQWLEQLSQRQYTLLLRSFLEVFPYVSLWANGSLLVGSKQPVLVDQQALERKFADPEIGPALSAIGLNSPDDFLNLYVGDRNEALAYVGRGPVITDDHPYVEYYRSLPADDRPPAIEGFSHDRAKIMMR
jgi:spermidine synthase